MNTRRTFLRTAVLGALSVPLLALSARIQDTKTPEQNGRDRLRELLLRQDWPDRAIIERIGYATRTQSGGYYITCWSFIFDGKPVGIGQDSDRRVAGWPAEELVEVSTLSRLF